MVSDVLGHRYVEIGENKKKVWKTVETSKTLEEILLADWSNLPEKARRRPPQMMMALQVLWKFQNKTGELPQQKDIEKLIAYVITHYATLKLGLGIHATQMSVSSVRQIPGMGDMKDTDNSGKKTKFTLKGFLGSRKEKHQITQMSNNNNSNAVFRPQNE